MGPRPPPGSKRGEEPSPLCRLSILSVLQRGPAAAGPQSGLRSVLLRGPAAAGPQSVSSAAGLQRGSVSSAAGLQRVVVSSASVAGLQRGSVSSVAGLQRVVVSSASVAGLQMAGVWTRSCTVLCFMLVGGTIDITVHEVLNGGKLKELHKFSGNDMGGQTVDRKFKELLQENFCDGVWDEYEREYPIDVQKIMYDFTVFKKHDDDVEISCPINLGTLALQVQDMEKFFERVQGASWNEGAINISRAKLRSFFDESLKSITTSLTEILKANSKIRYILLVGGYAGSQILREHIKDQFGRKCKVRCTSRPQEVIMKGAVMFGRNPEVLTSRKSALTYGITVMERFDASKYKANKKITNSGVDWCLDVFKKLVEIDEDVGWDEPREFSLFPVETNQTAMTFAFYCTEEKNPTYVDDVGLSQIGSFVVNMPNTAGGLDRKVKLEIKFGSTEMKATATDLDSGSTESVELNFMTKS